MSSTVAEVLHHHVSPIILGTDGPVPGETVMHLLNGCWGLASSSHFGTSVGIHAKRRNKNEGERNRRLRRNRDQGRQVRPTLFHVNAGHQDSVGPARGLGSHSCAAAVHLL